MRYDCISKMSVFEAVVSTYQPDIIHWSYSVWDRAIVYIINISWVSSISTRFIELNQMLWGIIISPNNFFGFDNSITGVVVMLRHHTWSLGINKGGCKSMQRNQASYLRSRLGHQPQMFHVLARQCNSVTPESTRDIETAEHRTSSFASRVIYVRI